MFTCQAMLALLIYTIYGSECKEQCPLQLSKENQQTLTDPGLPGVLRGQPYYQFFSCQGYAPEVTEWWTVADAMSVYDLSSQVELFRAGYIQDVDAEDDGLGANPEWGSAVLGTIQWENAFQVQKAVKKRLQLGVSHMAAQAKAKTAMEEQGSSDGGETVTTGGDNVTYSAADAYMVRGGKGGGRIFVVGQTSIG